MNGGWRVKVASLSFLRTEYVCCLSERWIIAVEESWGVQDPRKRITIQTFWFMVSLSIVPKSSPYYFCLRPQFVTPVVGLGSAREQKVNACLGLVFIIWTCFPAEALRPVTILYMLIDWEIEKSSAAAGCRSTWVGAGDDFQCVYEELSWI